MTDKSLTVSDWKSFAKDQKLDDAKAGTKETKALHDAVVKALGVLEPLKSNDHDGVLSALDGLGKALAAQVVANAKRKPKDATDGKALKESVKDVKERLDEMMSAVEKQVREVRQGKAAANEDEEDEGVLSDPKAMRKALGAALKKCAQQPQTEAAPGAPPSAPLKMLFAFVEANPRDKTRPAALVLRKKGRAKALFEDMQAAQDVKLGSFGQAWIEEARGGRTLMLQLEKAYSGLAKKVRQPVKAAGFKIAKALVWKEDGTVQEQDDAPDDAVEAEEADVADVATAKPSGSPPPPDAATLAFAKRLLALKAQVDKAATRGDAQADKLQALLASARQMVQDGNTSGGNDALTALDELLLAAAANGMQGRKGPEGLDAGAAFKARLTALIPRVKEAQASGGESALDAKLKASQAGVAAGKQDFERAQALLDEAEALLGGGTTGNAAAPAAGSGLERALSAWQNAREEAIAGLDELGDAVAYANYEESAKAIVLLRAIRAQLTAQPGTQRQVDELENYLKTDEVIGHAEARNGFGIQVRVRQPLLAALADLRPHVTQ